MKKYLGMLLSCVFTFVISLILRQHGEYNFFSFMLGITCGGFASILAIIINNFDN